MPNRPRKQAEVFFLDKFAPLSALFVRAVSSLANATQGSIQVAHGHTAFFGEISLVLASIARLFPIGDDTRVAVDLAGVSNSPVGVFPVPAGERCCVDDSQQPPRPTTRRPLLSCLQAFCLRSID